MKSKYLVLVFVFMLIFVPSVFAEETSTPSASPKPQIREEFQKKRQEALERMEKRKEEIRKKVLQIKDERKEKVITNLVDNFSKVNERRTTHWANVLTRLTEILTKIETRAEKLKSEGKDISGVAESIKEAKEAIAEAEKAVEAQKAKVYEVVIEGDSSLGENAREAISAFHEDMKKVFTLIREAREAVKNSFMELKDVAKGEAGDEQ